MPTCACGCGETVSGNRQYLGDAHRMRAARASKPDVYRHKATRYVTVEPTGNLTERRIYLNMTSSMFEKVTGLAEQEFVSRNAWIRRAIASAITEAG